MLAHIASNSDLLLLHELLDWLSRLHVFTRIFPRRKRYCEQYIYLRILTEAVQIHGFGYHCHIWRSYTSFDWTLLFVCDKKLAVLVLWHYRAPDHTYYRFVLATWVTRFSLCKRSFLRISRCDLTHSWIQWQIGRSQERHTVFRWASTWSLLP